MKSLPTFAAVLAAGLLSGCSSTPREPAQESVLDVINRYESSPGMYNMRGGAQCPPPLVAVCVSPMGKIGGSQCSCVDQRQIADQLAGFF